MLGCKRPKQSRLQVTSSGGKKNKEKVLTKVSEERHDLPMVVDDLLKANRPESFLPYEMLRKKRQKRNRKPHI